MKRSNPSRRILAFTLIELMAVLAVIAIIVLAVILFPVPHGLKPKAMRTACMSNLRQVGIGTVMWFTDHTNQFPWQVPAANGGTLEASDRGQVTPNFQALAEYVQQPNIFRCPADTARRAAMSYAGFSETNVSYFIHLDSGSNFSSSALAGDRNLQCDGMPVPPGLLRLTAESKLNWTAELHAKNPNVNPPGGNLLFVDGHVEWSKQDPSAALQRPDAAPNRLAVP